MLVPDGTLLVPDGTLLVPDEKFLVPDEPILDIPMDALTCIPDERLLLLLLKVDCAFFGGFVT